MNNETIVIKKENVVNVYLKGDDNLKKMLKIMFPDVDFEAEAHTDNRPITERVKTFEDACRELGEDHPFVAIYRCNEDIDECSADLTAYLKLRIICAALNEGWKPQFSEDEWRWYPWFYLWTSEELEGQDEVWKQNRYLISTDDFHTGYAGFTFAKSHNALPYMPLSVCSRLCLKREALADYCGKQFIDLWADFNLIRRK